MSSFKVRTWLITFPNTRPRVFLITEHGSTHYKVTKRTDTLVGNKLSSLHTIVKRSIICFEAVMRQDKITPREVASSLRAIGAPYGQDYQFSRPVDTSQCQWFFGTRCPHNVHITDEHTAHIDRFDPRYHLLEHIEEATGIPPWFTVLTVVLVGLGVGTYFLGRKN